MPTVMLIPIYLMIPTMHRALEVVRSLLLWKVWIPIDVGGVARYEEKCKRTPATGGADLAMCGWFHYPNQTRADRTGLGCRGSPL
jgi:hypothetical protein